MQDVLHWLAQLCQQMGQRCMQSQLWGLGRDALQAALDVCDATLPSASSNAGPPAGPAGTSIGGSAHSLREAGEKALTAAGTAFCVEAAKQVSYCGMYLIETHAFRDH